METPPSGYVALSVRRCRYLGTWTALQNIIVPSAALRNLNSGFIVHVNYILLDDKPNKFPSVTFKRRRHLTIIDTKLGIPAKPIRLYEATSTKLADNHLAVLHIALVDHGCCREQVKIASEPNLYRVKD